MSSFLAWVEAEAATSSSWLSTWKAVVIAALVIFGGMGVVVGAGAVRDLFSMLEDLKAGSEADREAAQN
ncbi:MAG: hypothetical protein AAF517_16655 [Planctomycetota bacterium]